MESHLLFALQTLQSIHFHLRRSVALDEWNEVWGDDNSEDIGTHTIKLQIHGF
jgi:hypothetical protein